MTLDSLYANTVALMDRCANTLDLCAKTIRTCKNDPEALECIAQATEECAAGCRAAVTRAERLIDD